MKQKYFNVMTENKDIKTQVVELMQANCDKEVEIKSIKSQAAEKTSAFDKQSSELKELRREREKQINERYALVMDINKRVNQLEEKQ